VELLEWKMQTKLSRIVIPGDGEKESLVLRYIDGSRLELPHAFHNEGWAKPEP